MIEEGFRLIDSPDGVSTYLRLSTRAINQKGETVCTMKRTALIEKRPQ